MSSSRVVIVVRPPLDTSSTLSSTPTSVTPITTLPTITTPPSVTTPPSITPPTTSSVIVDPPEIPTSSGSTITRVIVPVTSSSITSSTITSSQASRTVISSILVSSVTTPISSTSFTASPTTSPTQKNESSSNDSGSSPVLVTTISVVVGAILLALLAAWLIHALLKSRREKKENERLAADEDLDGMFQVPVMSNNSNGRNSLYDAHNDTFWDQKNENNRASIISIENVDYPRQSPEMDSHFISGAQDSEDHSMADSRLQNQNDVAVEGGVASMAIVGLARQPTMGSSSTSPLIPNAETSGNFVRVISDYTAVRPDEISMRQGQILMLEQTFQDGWAYGKNITTQERGMFPFNFVAPVDSSVFQQPPN